MFDLHPSSGPRFAIHLLPRSEGLTVHVTSPNGSTAKAHTVLQRIEDVLRMASQPGFHEDVGRGLFRSLLPGELGDLFRSAYTHATLSGAHLTVDLHLDPALIRIARYPWELLHDGTRFLLHSGAINLVRTLDFPEPVPAYKSHGPLEVLIANPQPSDQPALVPVGDTLEDTLNERIQTDSLDLAPLFPALWDTLMDWLLAGAPDVLHFEGFGDFTRTGRLFFEDARGRVDAVDADTLGAAFYSTGLRLAALSASVENNPGTESLLSSVAPTLIRAGIPAVIAVQQTLPYDDAARFWSAFYAALLDGLDLESAVTTARQQLRRTMYWHAIALYRRTTSTPVPVGEALPVRVDTATPDRAPVGWTVRAALWIGHAGSPPPAPDAIRRLVDASPPDPDQPPAGEPPPVPGDMLHAALQAGPVAVELSAPGCVIHNRLNRALTFNPYDTETPLPLWFALTPRESGDHTLRFTLSQHGQTVATVTHPLHVTATPEASAPLHYAHVPEPAHSAPTATGEHDRLGSRDDPDIARAMTPVPPPRTSGEPASAQDRDASRESRDRRDRLAAALPKQAPCDDPPCDEELDGVRDTEQTGQPPDEADDPLVNTPVPGGRAIQAAREAALAQVERQAAGGASPATARPGAARERDRIAPLPTTGDTLLDSMPPATRIPPPPAPATTTAAPPPRHRARLWWGLLGLVLLSVVIGVGIALLVL